MKASRGQNLQTMRSLPYSLLVLIIFGFSYCSAQSKNSFVEISGKKQHIRVCGTGKPTVVLVTGLAEPLTNFDSIQSAFSHVTRTFSYDRAGLGKSEPISVERSIDHMAQELEQLLQKSKIDPPYLLVGHSLGGMIIRYYNYLYPNNVAGMLLIDPASEKYDDVVRKGLSQKEIRTIDSLDYALTPWTRDERVPLAIRSEYQNFKTTDKELIKKTRFPTDKPVTIVSSARFSDVERKEQLSQREVDLWVKLHHDWTMEAPQIRHVTTEKSGHYIQNEEPDLIIAELQLLLDKVRQKSR
jgi:pimeloyl-ACP methyl ester carboxylesterase